MLFLRRWLKARKLPPAPRNLEDDRGLGEIVGFDQTHSRGVARSAEATQMSQSSNLQMLFAAEL